MAPEAKRARYDDSADSSKDSDYVEYVSMSKSRERLSSLAEVKPDGIICWTIDNFSQLTYRNSPTTEIYGVPWRLRAIAQMRPPYPNKLFLLLIQTNCGSDSPLWKFEFVYEIYIMKGNPSSIFKYQALATHDSNRSLSGPSLAFVLPNMQRRFFAPNQLTVEVQIYVKNFTGISYNPRFDLSPFGDTRSDMALVIEGNHLYVNKQYLAIYSPVFMVTFFGRFVETKKNEVALRDLAYEARALFLLELADRFAISVPHSLLSRFPFSILREFGKCGEGGIHTGRCCLRGIHRASVYRVPILRFCSISNGRICGETCSSLPECVVGLVEEFLIKTNEFTPAEKLRIAEPYNLSKLQDHCLSQLKTREDFKAIKEFSLLNSLL